MSIRAFAVLFLALPALAQVAPIPPQADCPDCGVIRSIKRVETVTRPAPGDDGRGEPSGLVASIPLKGGKATIGSSTKLDERERPPTVSYEVVVIMSDGRARIVRQDDAADLREGDKVRVDRGVVQLRH